MDLGSFLADESLGGGSWADEEVDLTSIGVPTTAAVPERQYQRAGSGQQSFDAPRRDREEYPIPDEPPYRARIGNLPWDITEDDVTLFFEKRMQARGIVTDVKLPADPSGKLKGFGFVTFTERDVLEEALQLTMADFNGRKMFVSVAAPQKQDVFDLDWRASRTGPLGGGRSRREEPDLDWGAARSEQGTLPPRERSNRKPRRDEPDLDWSSARGEGVLPPRERRPRREEPELDWGSARNEQGTLPPRERSIRKPKRDEPELDWGAARKEQGTLPPRERSYRKPRKQEPELDWGSARSDNPLPPRPRKASGKVKKEDQKDDTPGPQKSSYDILRIEGDSDAEEEEVPVKKAEPEPEPTLVEKTANLSISNENEDGWEVVRK